MKIKQLKERSQRGFLATKTALIVGAIMTASTVVALTGISALSTAATPEIGSPGSSEFCVTAAWVDNPDIKSLKGSCNTDENGVEIPEDEDVVIADPVRASYTCDIFTLNITQAMQDFSDANQKLKDVGKAGEMVAYPGGGWKIIAKASDLDPSFEGVLLTTDGEATVESPKATNSSGPAVMIISDRHCQGGNYINDEFHRLEGPAFVTTDYDRYIEHEYYVNGKAHRIDGPAYSYVYSDGKPPYGAYWLNGTRYQTSERDKWIEDGGLEAGWPL